ncbi:hypothetical protein AMAG_09760 [Allomyces macrogynus ATCC 38327]|uniref:Hsp70-like protein n=1 Tax=Allomyces macrogynus (strain ATCC 38327) TaxID=578462 RepID=A0A0L0STA2_ALLM3|nr:hypothetical protein AMAG_09760 [Allomyces macrogynus ATCC 38327]|eukprot:KNE65783.1 hypothetical protein AMAG_09760 [Allomyces macrogynus ATCC 38327]
MPPKKNAGNKKGGKPAKGGKGGSNNSSRPSTPAPAAPATPVQAAAPEPEVVAKEAIAVALSLGSEYATVTLLPTAAGQRGEVIADEDGERQIPAVVAVAGAEEIAGTAAKNQMVRNLTGTVRRFVPLLGLKYSDAKVQAAIANSAVPVEENAEGFPVFVITQWVHPEGNEDADAVEKVSKYTVVDLTAVLLQSLKQSAESYTGSPVNRCLLSYATDFTPEQQQALVRAAQQAGMEVTSLIPEPVAAALAFEHIKRTNENLGCNGLAMVVDLGASTTTLSLCNLFAGLITPIAHTTIPLGGLDLDRVLFTHFAAEFKKKQGHDIKGNRKAEEKLMLACELTRKVLSASTTSNCHVEAFYEGIDYVSVINRIRFEGLTGKWKRELEEAIRGFLDEQNVDADEIDHVLAVGGVAKIPMATRLLENVFGRAHIDTQVDGDEAVAYGTAIHGMQPAEHHSQARNHDDREIVTPHLTHALGLLDARGDFVTVIPRDTPVPVKHAVTIEVDGAASAWLQIAEARELVPLPDEDEDKEDDEDDEALPLYKGTVVGEIAVAATKGNKFEKVDVVFTVHENGKLHVSATAHEASTHHKVHASVDI